MGRKRLPKHGETVIIPAYLQEMPERARRWCGYCCTWTWRNAAGVFCHGKGHTNYCKRKKQELAQAAGARVRGRAK